MKYMLLLLCAVVLGSCNDFLDVRPKSEKVEKDLFADADGFESAIYGVYGYLATGNLYGMYLNWAVPDVLAQDFAQNTNATNALAQYKYDSDDNLRSRFSSIWSTAYVVIGYANNVLKNLDGRSQSELPLYNLYKGEMLAVRAYLHFDLLRLFCSTDESKTGIPYTTTYSMTVNEFKKVGEDYDLIIADLKEAEQLLESEKDDIVYPRDNTLYYKFQNYRETHCNYYAVLGMLAKVYWMRGDMANAAKYAQMVIESGKFPLEEASATGIQELFAGKLSDKETLWGVYSTSFVETVENYLYNQQSYSSYDPYTNESGTTYLMPYDKVYTQDVATTAQDYRLQWFKKGSGYVRCLKTVDYKSIEDKSDGNWEVRISGINMLHVSEIYLIAAEALLDTDYAKAVEYYNAETASRGLPALLSETRLTKDMIFNEYHKEMYGEGQVWYNMKRLNKDITSNYELRTIPASETVYTIPIPQDEYDYRN